MHLHRSGHGRGRARIVAGDARVLRALAGIVVLLHEMVTSAESDQMRIVGRRRNRDGACAAHVSVAQLVGQRLEFVGTEIVVIPQNVVVRGARSSLDSGVAVGENGY